MNEGMRMRHGVIPFSLSDYFIPVWIDFDLSSENVLLNPNSIVKAMSGSFSRLQTYRQTDNIEEK